jgi:hypothetical protein
LTAWTGDHALQLEYIFDGQIDSKRLVILNHYRKNLRTAVGSSAGPYSYTLATWTTGAVLTEARGIPDTLAALTFMTGAVLGFAFVGALAFGGVAKHFDRERGQAVLWGSFHRLSVGLAIGVAALVAHYVENSAAWPLAAFLSTAVYLLVLGAESTAAYLWDHRGKPERTGRPAPRRSPYTGAESSSRTSSGGRRGVSK